MKGGKREACKKLQEKMSKGEPHRAQIQNGWVTGGDKRTLIVGYASAADSVEVLYLKQNKRENM